ncbi:MAG: RlmE family RNA methyltransferase [Candidatus Binatia bacterium]
MTYRPKDLFYHKAKKEGYRSRAAYKLLELNRRFNLIKPGDRVVDLGAAPGGWLQIASQLTGPKGKVVGIDIQSIKAFKDRNIFLLRGDITSGESQMKIQTLLGSSADCVLSDLAPRLTGIRHADVHRSIELARIGFEIARRLLRPGGNFLVKTFIGEEMKIFSLELAACFRSVQGTRPVATRKGSSEIYFCVKGFKKAADSD